MASRPELEHDALLKFAVDPRDVERALRKAMFGSTPELEALGAVEVASAGDVVTPLSSLAAIRVELDDPECVALSPAGVAASATMTLDDDEARARLEAFLDGEGTPGVVQVEVAGSLPRRLWLLGPDPERLFTGEHVRWRRVSRLSSRTTWNALRRIPVFAAALLMATVWAASGCRRCVWPDLLVRPDNPAATGRDWSELELAVTEVYVSRRRCRRGQRREAFLAVGLRPLPVEFWDAGGTLEVAVDGWPQRWVMVMPNDAQRRVIYLHGPLRGRHELTLELRDPGGGTISEHRLSIDAKTLARHRDGTGH